MTRKRALWAVLVTAVLFATGGAAIKSASLSAWQISGLRSLVAFVVLWAAFPAVRRRWSRGVLLVGLPYAGVMVLFVHANTLTLAATTTLLQASAPLYVALLGPWLLREALPRRLLLLLPLFGAGTFLLLSEATPATAVATDPDLGRWLAAAAGLCYGLVILGLRHLETGGSSGPGTGIRAVACGNLFAFLVSAPFMASGRQPLDGVDLTVVLYLGCIQIGLAYLLLMPAMRVLPALEVSLLLLVELVASPFFAALLHGEVPGPRTMAGGALILLACILQSLRRQGRAVPGEMR